MERKQYVQERSKPQASWSLQEEVDAGVLGLQSGPKKVSYLEQAWPQLPLVSSFSLHLFLPGYAVPKGGITRHQTGGATESWAFSLKSIEADESFFFTKFLGLSILL